MDRLEHLEIDLLDISSVPYRLSFRSTPSTPTLDKYVNRGDPKSGKPFASGDLKPARVGFVRINNSEIDCVPMTWAQHLWTNLDEVRSGLPEDEQLHVLVASVLVETADSMFPLALRSKNVTTYPEHWHVSAAGYVDLAMAQRSRSLLHTIFTELEEEINVSARHVLFAEQLGLFRQTRPNTAIVEASFHAKSRLGSDEILSRAQSAIDTYEGKIHLFSRDSILRMLETEPFVPTAKATALLTFGCSAGATMRSAARG